MKKQNMLHALRTTKDRNVREQIANRCPADWDMEKVFEKTYQAYLEDAGERVPIRRTSYKNVYRVAAAAACLILTVGLGVGVWSKQQRIETRPPQEMQTATVTTTQSGTETTAAPHTTTAQTTGHTPLPETTCAAAVSIPGYDTTLIYPSSSIHSASETGTAQNFSDTPETTRLTAVTTAAVPVAPISTIPSTSKEETYMKHTTRRIETTITALMTTAALITSQPLTTAATNTTVQVSLPGYATRYGDVNLDQEVTLKDLVTMQHFLLGKKNKIKNLKNADLTGDGVIDIYDLAVLKRGLVSDMEGIGGTMRIKLVNPYTGELLDRSAHVKVWCFCHDGDEDPLFEVTQWDYAPGDVWELHGLPTGSEYLYEVAVYSVEGDNRPKDCGGRLTMVEFEGETEKDVTVEASPIDPNVVVRQVDWTQIDNRFAYFNYGYAIVTNEQGEVMDHIRFGSKEEYKLPDGNYHAEWKFDTRGWGRPENQGQLVDPDSDFAKEYMKNHPDVVFTDQSKGIDFTVKDGKPDREVQFNFIPLQESDNQLTVNCIDSMTGEPVEGVKLSLIYDPSGTHEVLDSWTSDETGSKHFEHSGYPYYKVVVDQIPEGYTGTFSDNMLSATSNDKVIDLRFTPDTAEKNVSVNIVKWEDKSLLNDVATYDLYKYDDLHSFQLMGDVKAGEKLALPDGEYVANLHGDELLATEYRGINYGCVSGKKIFEENDLSYDEFLHNTAIIHFYVKDGKPDRDPVFYVKLHEADDDVEAYEDVDYDPILKYFYGIK